MAWYKRILNLFIKSKVDIVNRESVASIRSLNSSGKDADALKQDTKIQPELAARIYDQSPYVLAGVKKVASAIASLDLNVYAVKNNVRKPVYNGYPYKTLQYINPHTTPYEFKYSVAAWLALTGEAFIVITKSKDSKQQIYLEVLNNQYIEKVAGTDRPVSQIKYVIPGVNDANPLVYDSDSFIHIKTFNPKNSYDGHCPLVAIENDIAIERYMKTGLESSLKKVNNISAVVTVPSTTSEDEMSTVATELESKSQHYGNGHKTLVVKEGTTYEPVKPITLPMNYEESKVFEVSENSIGMVMGVPIALLKGDSTSDKLIEQEAVMWKNTIIPLVQLIEEQLTKFLAVPENASYRIEFDISQVEALSLYKLERTRMQVAKVMTGINTVNEVRVENGNEEYTDSETKDFGTLPKPVYDAMIAEQQQNVGVSASLSLPGSEGGRDQSSSGEAQMIDTTGTKTIVDDIIKL
jgi:HK97 family phage portal protein